MILTDMVVPERFRFSTRDLAYLVTFLCVVFGLSLRAGEQSPLVLFNGIVLAVIAFLRGAWLYKWLMVGACATHTVWLFLFVGSHERATLIESSDLLNISIISLTIGALIGVVMGLGPRRETFGSCRISPVYHYCLRPILVFVTGYSMT
jgi:hypothetical protein